MRSVEVNRDVLPIVSPVIGSSTGSQVISYPLIIESNPKNITASCEGLGATLIMAAGAIFQPLFGYLLHWSNPQNTTGTFQAADFHAPMMIFPITFAIAFILSLLLKETHCKAMD